MEVDEPFHPGKRPSTPVKTSWFEFLLNPFLIEEHLQQDYPDPSATDLIALFLYQSDVAASTAKEIKEDAEQETPNLTENKKVRALKLLALKVAAHLKWNLTTLNKSIPLAMVQDILLELLKMTLSSEEEADPAKHLSLDLNTLPEHALFAVQLYHRWCLKVILEDSFPSKPNKTQGVQVPGLEIPVLNSANGKETVMAIVKEGLTTSINVLNVCRSCARDVIMPSLKSLGHIDHDTKDLEQDWELGVTTPGQEVLAQICYDLGCMNFDMHKYDDALTLFKQATDILPQISESSVAYCTIDSGKLTGYCIASQSMSTAEKPSPTSLYDKMEQAKKVQTKVNQPKIAWIKKLQDDKNRAKWKDVVDLLLEDNQLRELNLEYRGTLEEYVHKQIGGGSIYQEVVLCNAVRRALQGGDVISMLCERLLMTSKHNIRFTVRCITVTQQNLTPSQQINLKTFVRYLCYKLPREMRFTQSVLEPSIRILFTNDEIHELTILANGAVKEKELLIKDPAAGGTEQSDLEQQLLNTYEPAVIKDLVQKLLAKTSKTSIMFLSDQWRLPQELSHPIGQLPIPWVQVYTHVLVVKANIGIKLKLYNKAKELLKCADDTIKDISYKLAKILKWELLKLDLQQHQETGVLSPGTTRADVIKRCKTTIETLSGGKKDLPPAEIVSSAVAFLYNTKEWDYLTSLNTLTNGFVQMSRLLVAASSNFQNHNYSQITQSRKAARELWEVVALIFTTSTQQKRSGSGTVTKVERDSNIGVLPNMAFTTFITKIKDHVTISAVLSCLVKLYSILKTDVNAEMFADFLPLWPTTVANATGMNTNSVSECLSSTLQYARSLDVVNSSWIRTHADYCFASGDHSNALRHYLELGVLVTDYFNEQVTRNVYDEPIVKRMIKCCSSLKCHTQVAVLCQCLDEIDYSTAFKALQDSNSEDAMDTFYPYLWDSTMLEYIINLHHKRGEMAKKQQAIKAIGDFEVNCSNPPEILFEAAKVRKSNFFRAMVKQHL